MFRANGTIKSLKPFSKVCSNSRHSSLNSIKTLAFFQNLSTTATERSEFGNPNGFDGDNLLEYEETASGSYSPANYNNSNLELKLNSSGQQFRDQLQNPDGNQVGVNQNPTRIYGQYDKIEFSQKQFGRSGNNFRYLESPINEIGHIPVGKEGSYSSGYNRGSTRAEFQQNPLGENWKFSNGYTSESPRNEVQQNPSAKNGNFNGNYGQNAGEFWQNPTRFNKESFKDSMKIVDGVLGGNVNAQGIRREGAGAVQQNPNGLYGLGSAEANASYGQYTMQSQRSSSNDKMGNMKNIGTSQHSSYNSDTGSTEHVAGNYYGANTGKYQQSPSDYYGAMTGSPNGYPGETPNGYPGGTNGQYVQNPVVDYRNYAGPQQIPNVYQNGMGVLQDTSNSTAEGTYDNRLIGSVEKFDDYCKEGKLKKAVEVLGLLEHKHINIDTPRYVMLMKLCGEAKALEEAKNIHDLLMRSVSHIDVRTYNKILEMYCNCGSLDDSYVVFEKMPQRNLTTWDTMIVGLAKNGRAEESINLFARFKESGLKPDGQMFISVFSACSFLGDVTEGMLHFESMSKTYGIVPSMDYYVSIVDMMGSIGYLDEALEFIEKMPVDPSIEIWETLMNLCRVHGNTELGDRCAGLVELLDPSRLHEQSKVGLIPVKASDIAKEKEKKLDLLQVRSRVHEYRAGDTSHPDNDKIYALLRGMRQQMKEAGYIPETKFVLHDIDQESKEDALLAHSERLAVAQGLMSSPARSSMRIIKNLRVCGDCHNALKIISKLVGRELIIRDAKRFHHFKDGLCSCRDYW